MLETLLGSLIGTVSRLIPEGMKWLDRKNERAHELALLTKQIEADKLRATQNIQLEQTKGSNEISSRELQSIIEATKAQATVTGVKWIDAVSSLMRPAITFWWVIVLYTSFFISKLYLLLLRDIPLAYAIKLLWGDDEMAIVASIISFWFVDRSLRKLMR